MAGPLCSRPPDPRARCRALRLLCALALLAGGALITCAPVLAQQLNFPTPAPPHEKSAIERERDKPGAQKQMLVQANEINYDYNNKRVAAVGNVQIYYGG